MTIYSARWSSVDNSIWVNNDNPTSLFTLAAAVAALYLGVFLLYFLSYSVDAIDLTFAEGETEFLHCLTSGDSFREFKAVGIDYSSR